MAAAAAAATAAFTPDHSEDSQHTKPRSLADWYQAPVVSKQPFTDPRLQAALPARLVAAAQLQQYMQRVQQKVQELQFTYQQELTNQPQQYALKMAELRERIVQDTQVILTWTKDPLRSPVKQYD